MTTALIILFTILFTWFTAKIDSEFWNSAKGRYVENHTSRFLQRITYCLTMAIFSYKHCAISAMVFWLFFDQFLNYQKGRHIFYLGTTAKMCGFFSKRLSIYLLAKGVDLFLLVAIILEPTFILNIISIIKDVIRSIF